MNSDYFEKEYIKNMLEWSRKRIVDDKVQTILTEFRKFLWNPTMYNTKKWEYEYVIDNKNSHFSEMICSDVVEDLAKCFEPGITIGCSGNIVVYHPVKTTVRYITVYWGDR